MDGNELVVKLIEFSRQYSNGLSDFYVADKDGNLISDFKIDYEKKLIILK